MNKRDIVAQVATDADLTRAQATRALEAILGGIQASLVRGDRVTLSGFGAFDIAHHKARRVRNPSTGHAIEVRARRVPRFVAAPDFKSAVDR